MDSPPPCAGKRLCCNRSLSNQLPQVNPRCAYAARGSVSGLVSAAGGLARNHEWSPEFAGSGAFRHTPPQRHYQGTRLGVAAAAIGFLVPLLFPTGGCTRAVRCDP